MLCVCFTLVDSDGDGEKGTVESVAAVDLAPAKVVP